MGSGGGVNVGLSRGESLRRGVGLMVGVGVSWPAPRLRAVLASLKTMLDKSNKTNATQSDMAPISFSICCFMTDALQIRTNVSGARVGASDAV